MEKYGDDAMINESKPVVDGAMESQKIALEERSIS
jgi:hypothetical protein